MRKRGGVVGWWWSDGAGGRWGGWARGKGVVGQRGLPTCPHPSPSRPAPSPPAPSRLPSPPPHTVQVALAAMKQRMHARAYAPPYTPPDTEHPTPHPHRAGRAGGDEAVGAQARGLRHRQGVNCGCGRATIILFLMLVEKSAWRGRCASTRASTLTRCGGRVWRGRFDLCGVEVRSSAPTTAPTHPRTPHLSPPTPIAHRRAIAALHPAAGPPPARLFPLPPLPPPPPATGSADRVRRPLLHARPVRARRGGRVHPHPPLGCAARGLRGRQEPDQARARQGSGWGPGYGPRRQGLELMGLLGLGLCVLFG